MLYIYNKKLSALVNYNLLLMQQDHINKLYKIRKY